MKPVLEMARTIRIVILSGAAASREAVVDRRSPYLRTGDARLKRNFHDADERIPIQADADIRLHGSFEFAGVRRASADYAQDARRV
jgi:hypothetical protein